MKKSILLFGFIFVAALVVNYLIVESQEFEMFPCENLLKKEVASADGLIVAAVYVKGCGATADNVTHVHMRHASSTLNEGESNGGEIIRVNGEKTINLTWNNNSQLDIYVERRSELENKVKSIEWNGVSIRIFQ